MASGARRPLNLLLSGGAHFGRALNHAPLLVVVGMEVERVGHLINAEVLREGHMIRDTVSAGPLASLTPLTLL